MHFKGAFYKLFNKFPNSYHLTAFRDDSHTRVAMEEVSVRGRRSAPAVP